MVDSQERVFGPGDSARAVVRLINTGETPSTFVVEVTPGTSLIPVGFVAERPPVTLLTPVITPGQEVSVRVPFLLPETGGPKLLRVLMGEAGPTGMRISTLDESVVSGLVRVEIPTEAPLPDEFPDDLPPPTPEDLALQFSQGLGFPQVTLDPQTVELGQTTRGNLSISNTAGIPFSPRLEVNIISGQQEIRTLIQPRTLNLTPNQDIFVPLTIDTMGLPVDPDTGFSPYGLRVILLDPVTGIMLLDTSLSALFRVTVPLPELPAGLMPGDLLLTPLQLPDPPFISNPGDTMSLTLQFEAVLVDLPVTPQLAVDAWVQDASRKTFITLPRQAVGIVPGSTADVTFTWVLPGDLPEALYGVRVEAFDPNTVEVSGLLIQAFIFPLFRLEIPIAPPPPPPPPVPLFEVGASVSFSGTGPFAITAREYDTPFSNEWGYFIVGLIEGNEESFWAAESELTLFVEPPPVEPPPVEPPPEELPPPTPPTALFKVGDSVSFGGTGPFAVTAREYDTQFLGEWGYFIVGIVDGEQSFWAAESELTLWRR